MKRAKSRKPLALPIGPLCPYCGNESQLRVGSEIYPHRADLWDKFFWKCDPCGAYCGCHPGTKKALGVPASAELRKARSILHDQMLDPLWKNAVVAGGYEPEDEKARIIIVRTARSRVYDFLADRLVLTKEQTHTGLFDIETCRAAWRVLAGVTYPEIRAWAKARKEAQGQAA
jgi:hypothetical protein